MGYDRRWLDEPHVGDHVGRSVWALGEILATAWIPAVVEPDAATCSTRLVGDARRRRLAANGAPTRCSASRASTPTGSTPTRGACSSASSSSSPTPTRSTAADGWSWFEDELTYDNARLPQALIVGGSRARPRRPGRARARVARWLGDECGPRRRHAAPDRPPRSRTAASPRPGAGDEQPLDAAALVEAELAAFAVTGRAGARSPGARARSTGSSAATGSSRPLYDFATGGCSDGLGDDDAERQRRRRVDARLPPRRAPPRRRRRPRARRRDARSSRRPRERAASSSAAIPATRS